MQVNERCDDSKTCLQQTQIHEAWEPDYLNPDIDRFYHLAFGEMVAHRS